MDPPDQVTEGLDHSMIEFEFQQLQFSGASQARPGSAEETVEVLAPHVRFSARVWLAERVRLGVSEGIDVGPVQTLLGSERVGVFREGGSPDGQIVTENHIRVREVRDAMFHEEGEERREAVRAPWYSRPTRLSNYHSGRRSDGRPDRTVGFVDRPGFTMPASIGGGRLTEVRGLDRFITSLAAKRGERLIHLINYQWEVPWAITVNPEGRGRGGELGGEGYTEREPATTTGEIAVRGSEQWVSYASVEAAMTSNSNTLLYHLANTHRHDLDAWEHMVEALRRKNPTLRMQVGVERPADEAVTFGGGDEVMLRVTGRATREQEVGTLGRHEFRNVNLHLLDIFPDPAAITARPAIQFRVWDAGTISHSPATISWEYPFNPHREWTAMSGSEGSYKLTYQFYDES